MNKKDEIKELFAQKLRNQEAPVNPALWNSIASGVASKTVVSTGLSLGLKAGLFSLVLATSVGIVYVVNKDNSNKTTKQQKIASSSKEKEAVEISETKEPSKITSPKLVAKSNPIITFKHSEETKHSENINEKQVTNFEKEFVTESGENESKIISEIIIPNESVKTLVKEQEKTTTISESNSKQAETIPSSLPNLFTPNGDGENDFFKLAISGLTDFSLTILNENNIVVFSTSDLNFQWDGRDFKNELVPSGNYIYYFTGKDVANNVVNKFSKLLVKY